MDGDDEGKKDDGVWRTKKKANYRRWLTTREERMLHEWQEERPGMARDDGMSGTLGQKDPVKV